jgi:hypothetical protein
MPATEKKSTLELVVEVIKALAWPLFATVFLVSFWTPLHDTATLIPSIVSRSDTITIAGLSLKVGKALNKKATPEVELALSRLSKEGVKRLLEMSASSWWDKGSEANGQAENSELVKLGLAMEVSADELATRNTTDHKNFGYAVRITDLGRKTQDFLRAVIAEFVDELPRTQTIPPSNDLVWLTASCHLFRRVYGPGQWKTHHAAGRICKFVRL